MRFKDFIKENQDNSDFIKRLKSRVDFDPSDTDDDDLPYANLDYTQKAYDRMGWGRSPHNDRSNPNRIVQKPSSRTNTELDDNNYYTKSSDAVKLAIDDIEAFAEQNNATVQVDYWDNKTNWQLGIMLPNDKNFRVKLNKNGKISRFEIAYGTYKEDLKPQIAEYLNNLFKENKIDCEVKSSGRYLLTFDKTSGYFSLDEFKKLFLFLKKIVSDDKYAYNLIRSGYGDISQTGDRVKSLIRNELTESNYYIGIATLIYNAVKFGIRDFLPQRGKEKDNIFDLDNKGITVGYTAGAKALIDDPSSGVRPYREHVVPVDLIIRYAVQMANEAKVGVDLTNLTDIKKIMEVDHELIMQIANMIKRNLLIVLTDPKESDYIDNTLKLRTVMPEGSSWDPENGDRFSRFKAASEQSGDPKKFRIYRLDNGSNRLAETDN